ncbi:MAG: DUF2975 domain-containing protein [Candidatus Ventricola sp.]
MKKLEFMRSEHAVFRVLRIAAAAAGVIGTLIAVWLACVGVSCLSWGIGDRLADVIGAAATGLVTVAVVSICCWRALIVFVRMVGRLSQGSAFTEENTRAMAAIAGALALSGAAILAAFVLLLLICREMVLPMIFLVLLALAFFGLALIAHALGLLVRRAAQLQRDSDLTI